MTYLLIYLGICQFSIAFAKDISDRFSDFKDEVNSVLGNDMINKEKKLQQKLIEIIQFHTIAIELSVLISCETSYKCYSFLFQICN